MGCLQYAIDGKCCICYEKVTDREPGYRADELTEIETRSGTHYTCGNCLQNIEDKYERGKIDIFEIKEE